MTETTAIAADRLKSFIERIERLEEDKAAIAADIKEVYAEAKSNGFNVKIMRQMIKERKVEPAEREEWWHLVDVYRHSLGMLEDTPLGRYALRGLGLAESAPPGETTH